MPDQSGPPPLNDTSFRFCPACGSALASGPPVRCPACGTHHWRNAKPCAGALVTNGGKLLLVRRAFAPYEGWWDIPGGFCEPDEHPADAAVREVREETGLEVAVTGLLGLWMDTYRQHGTVQSTLNVYFTARPRGAVEFTLDPAEATDARWFAPHDVPEQVAFPDHTGSVLASWRAGSPTRSD